MSKTDLIILGGGDAVAPYRPGRIVFEVDPKVIRGREDKGYGRCGVNGTVVGQTRGVSEIEKWGADGRVADRRAPEPPGLHFAHQHGGWKGRGEPASENPPDQEAMVMVEGVALVEIDSPTLESKCPGLYFSGRGMDVDGPIGGYNQQTAVLQRAARGRVREAPLWKKAIRSSPRPSRTGRSRRKRPRGVGIAERARLLDCHRAPRLYGAWPLNT